MLTTEVVNPNVGNLVESLRDIGYSFEVSVADLIDNSITANARSIKIYTVSQPELILSLLDDGTGMTETELIEAMRLASKDPKDLRDKNDLGRFGLGLKTASFSQCKRLTVVSKKDDTLCARQWDLDYVSKENSWLLITPKDFTALPQIQDLIQQKSGTLVCWENIDRLQKHNFSSVVARLRKHISLVFHRFIEGDTVIKSVKIAVNNIPIIAFDPFNSKHLATQEASPEKIKLYGSTISVQPYILPHHSKISQQEYELYATEDGYIKSQGFYVYRENRILIYGTWWGLHKSLDAHKLVRIKIDIPNTMDMQWGIDIKKSLARPSEELKTDLKRIISQVTERGSRPYTGRARKIEDKTFIQFWHLMPLNNDFRFAINIDHPLYKDLEKDLSKDSQEKLRFYLKGIEAYLPLEAIQSKLQKSPHLIKQKTAISEVDIAQMIQKLKSAGLSQEYIEDLLKTDLLSNRNDILNNGDE